MVRVSLKEAYDDRSVIKKIADLEAKKQDKLTAGQGVTIDGTTISVDTSDLATQAALDAARASLSHEIKKVDDKTIVNADAILTIENELGSDALPGTIFYRITKVEGDITTLTPIVNRSVRDVTMDGDASTVYHKATHNDGSVETDAMPVASGQRAGVMSAGMYTAMNGSIDNLRARIIVLEGANQVYSLTGLPDNPTNDQITDAFQNQYPQAPLNAGTRAADYSRAKIWQYSGVTWIQLTAVDIRIATNDDLGVVKGSADIDANKGKIFLETDGSMTVLGWDQLVASVNSNKGSLENMQNTVNDLNTSLSQTKQSLSDLSAEVTQNKSDITTANQGIAELQRDVSSQGTQIAGKQDKLTAGENITIAGNVISAKGGETYVAGEGIKIEGNVISATNTSVPVYNPLIVGSVSASSEGSGGDVECDIASFGTGSRSNGSYSLPYSTTKQTLSGVYNVPGLVTSNVKLDFSPLNIPNKSISYNLIIIDSANNVIGRQNGQGVLDATSKLSVTLNSISWFKLGSSNRNLSIAAVNVIWS